MYCISHPYSVCPPPAKWNKDQESRIILEEHSTPTTQLCGRYMGWLIVCSKSLRCTREQGDTLRVTEAQHERRVLMLDCAMYKRTMPRNTSVPSPHVQGNNTDWLWEWVPWAKPLHVCIAKGDSQLWVYKTLKEFWAELYWVWYKLERSGIKYKPEDSFLCKVVEWTCSCIFSTLIVQYFCICIISLRHIINSW